MQKGLKKSTIFFSLAAVLALFIGLRVQHLLNDVKQAGVVQVVTVKDDIALAPFTVIQAADVQLRVVPKASIQPDTFYSVEDVVGKRTAMAILPSTVLRRGHLLVINSLVGVLSSLGKDNVVAVTIPIDAEQARLGEIGEFVTLHGIVRQGTDPALLSVRKVPILEKTDQVVTLAVTIEQSDALDQIMLSGGKIRMALDQS